MARTLSSKGTAEPSYCVWYASAGCLPDAEEPELVGTLEECERYVASQRAQREAEPRAEHDLYDWTIDELEPVTTTFEFTVTVTFRSWGWGDEPDVAGAAEDIVEAWAEFHGRADQWPKTTITVTSPELETWDKEHQT